MTPYIRGMRCAEIRKQRGLTQTELAHLAGCEQSQISKFEAGSDGITLRFVNKIAEVLKVSRFDLFSDERTPGSLGDVDRLEILYESLSDEGKGRLIGFGEGLLAANSDAEKPADDSGDREDVSPSSGQKDLQARIRDLFSSIRDEARAQGKELSFGEIMSEVDAVMSSWDS